MEKRSVRNHVRTPEQIERDRQLRAKYQSSKPTLAELQASNEYFPAITQREYFEMLEFAARLKATREEMKLSLADLAEKSGIDRAAISRLENGQAENPTYNTLERVARALNKRLRLVLEDEPTSISTN